MHAHPHGIVVYPNRLKLLGWATLCALFFVAIFSLRDPSNAQGDPRYYLAMFCGLPLFGFGALFSLARALWPGPSLVINEDGIFDHTIGIWHSANTIPWSNIAGFEVVTIKHRLWKERRLYIVLHNLTPESRASLARSRWRGAIAGKMIRMTGRPHLTIMQTYLSTSIPELLREIERHYPAQLNEHNIVVVADG
jgi:hypothetical protein